MNLRKIQIELEPSEIQKLLAIDMDDDEAQALLFIKQVLSKKVEKRLQRR